MPRIFYLPDHPDNRITENDIMSGKLRITANSKGFFPEVDSTLQVKILGVSFDASFRKSDDRSDLLYLNKRGVALLELGIHPRLKFTVKNKTYHIEKAEIAFSRFETDGINYTQFNELCVKYYQLLEAHPFPSLELGANASEAIRFFKRSGDEKRHIGPYYGITIFEAANRIGSDLVMLKGIRQVVEQEFGGVANNIDIFLGNRKQAGCGDFSIEGKKGEAFNVSHTFFNGKYSNTRKKWSADESSLEYILVNDDAISDSRDMKQDRRIRRIRRWDELT